MNSIPNGTPTLPAYCALLASPEFKSLEDFSNEFIDEFRSALGHYKRKWVLDPLHQWSRQWEYPYVFSEIASAQQTGPKLRILDAGSGATFFPFFLADRIPHARISCCDSDSTLSRIFSQMNHSFGKQVEFNVADLRKLPFPDASFDVVYCVSVLEHTNAYETIIDEFHRVLAPRGRLIVTFDISIEGTRDIDVETSQCLINSLMDRFQPSDRVYSNLQAQLEKPDLFTTANAQQIDPSLLPWRLPSLFYKSKNLLTSGKWINWPPFLTFYCLSMGKEPK